MRSERAAGALLLAIALGCAHAPTAAPGPGVGERFSLRAGESASIRDTGVAVTFERILSDNRCAIDVVCIVAGEARAALRLERAGERPVAFVLDTDRESTAVIAGYRVSLHAVLPAPRSTVRTDPRDYTVELSVSRS